MVPEPIEERGKEGVASSQYTQTNYTRLLQWCEPGNTRHREDTYERGGGGGGGGGV